MVLHGRRFNRDARHTWLTKGLHTEFDTLIPMGSKKTRVAEGEAIGVIFKTYSGGVKTNRDAWVYNFDRDTLAENISRMVESYNMEVVRWGQRPDRNVSLDNFVVSDDTKIKWSRDFKSEIRTRSSN